MVIGLTCFPAVWLGRSVQRAGGRMDRRREERRQASQPFSVFSDDPKMPLLRWTHMPLVVSHLWPCGGQRPPPFPFCATAYTCVRSSLALNPFYISSLQNEWVGVSAAVVPPKFMQLFSCCRTRWNALGKGKKSRAVMHTSVAMHLISWALVLKHSGDLLFLKAGVLFRSNQISRSINSLLGSQAEHIVPLSPYACHHNKRKKKHLKKKHLWNNSTVKK